MGDQAAMGALFGLGLFSIIGLVFILLFYVPLVMYLLNLQRTFNAIQPQFRPSVPIPLLWLSLVPGLGLFVLAATVVLLSVALKKEDEARGSTVFGDGGLTLGLAFVICGLLTIIPLLGILLGLGSLVCWIMHWIRIAAYRKTLEALTGLAPAYGVPPAPAYAPPPVQPAPTYAPPPAPPAPPVQPMAPTAPAAPWPPAPTAPAPAPAAPIAPTTPIASTVAAEDATALFINPAAAKLVCVVGVVQGMTFPVGSGVTLGRSQEANVVLPDGQVSNRHAWVGPVDGKLVLRDLGSTNGSYLNDNLAAPVQEAELREGDLIVLGKHGQMKLRVTFS